MKQPLYGKRLPQPTKRPQQARKHTGKTVNRSSLTSRVVSESKPVVTKKRMVREADGTVGIREEVIPSDIGGLGVDDDTKRMVREAAARGELESKGNNPKNIPIHASKSFDTTSDYFSGGQWITIKIKNKKKVRYLLRAFCMKNNLRPTCVQHFGENWHKEVNEKDIANCLNGELRQGKQAMPGHIVGNTVLTEEKLFPVKSMSWDGYTTELQETTVHDNQGRAYNVIGPVQVPYSWYVEFPEHGDMCYLTIPRPDKRIWDKLHVQPWIDAILTGNKALPPGTTTDHRIGDKLKHNKKSVPRQDMKLRNAAGRYGRELRVRGVRQSQFSRYCPCGNH